ncbi:MAG TPA: transcriptional repressor [Anaerolineae bacterium]|jgi:Fur family ferric uptake transcriptional regulator|nr:transcriptional repressor [Anaerolineae bacterium]
MRAETVQFKNFIEAKGLIFTPERQSVAEEVFSNHDHLNAENVLKNLKTRGSKVSRATVYRALDLLVESGLVEKIDLGDDKFAYEHVAGHPHHDHLVCLRCGGVQEFEEPLIEQLQAWACEKANFKATGHNLNIYGYCKNCTAE